MKECHPESIAIGPMSPLEAVSRPRPRHPRTYGGVLVILLLSFSACAPTFSSLCCASPTSWSHEGLRFFDELRLSPLSEKGTPSTLQATGSSVVRVTLAQNVTSGDTRDGRKPVISYRLCHLTSMLPATDGARRLQTEFGLSTKGAGLLAMIHFNNRVDSIVPELRSNARIRQCDVRFTIDFVDTEFSPIAASRALLRKVLPPAAPPHTLATPRPCSLVGATRSAVSGPLSVLSSTEEIPVISYGSTSSQLDNKDMYPYFGRTVPTNTADAYFAVKYLREVLGASHVGVVFVRDVYGNSYFRDFATAASALDPPMAIISASYDASGVNLESSLQKGLDRLAESGYNYFFGILSTLTYDRVMSEAWGRGVVGPGKFWLLSDSASHILGSDFGYDRIAESVLADATSGVKVISLDIQRNGAFDEAWKALERDAKLKDYFVSKQPKYLDMSNFSFPKSPTFWEYLQYDAVIALGFAACDADAEFFTGPDLFQSFRGASFRGASGNVSFDGHTATRNSTRMPFKIVNVVAANAAAANEGHRITFSTTKVAHTVATKETDSGVSSMTWITLAPTTYADGSHTAPLAIPPMMVDLNLIEEWALAFGFIFNGTIIILCLVWTAWTIRHRKSRIVSLASSKFLLMLCAGTFIMSCAVIPMSLQEPVSQRGLDVACMSIPWLFSVGFVVSFSALFSKTLRIKKLVSEGQDCRKVKLKARDLLVGFFTLFTCTFVLLISWTIVAPVKWERTMASSFDAHGRSVESHGECGFRDNAASKILGSLILIVFITCILYALYENYRARNVPSEYFESHYVGISIVSIAQLLVFAVPVLAAVSGQPQLRYLVLSSALAMMGASFLFPIFMPKVISMRKDMQSKYLNSLLKVERQKTFELATRNFDLKEEVDIVRASKSKKRRSSFGCTSPRPSRSRRKRSSVF